MTINVFLTPPPNFIPKVTFVGCYCLDSQDKVLLLKRNANISLGGRWGIPGGKPNEGESTRQTIKRELEEETGIKVKEDEFEELDKVYVRHFEADVMMYRFRVHFLEVPEITLNLDEHSEAQWFTREEALLLSEVTGGVKALIFFQSEV